MTLKEVSVVLTDKVIREVCFILKRTKKTWFERIVTRFFQKNGLLNSEYCLNICVLKFFPEPFRENETGVWAENGGTCGGGGGDAGCGERGVRESGSGSGSGSGAGEKLGKGGGRGGKAAVFLRRISGGGAENGCPTFPHIHAHSPKVGASLRKFLRTKYAMPNPLLPSNPFCTRSAPFHKSRRFFSIVSRLTSSTLCPLKTFPRSPKSRVSLATSAK